MTDRYAELIRLPVGRTIAKQIGLPLPTWLQRHDPARPDLAGTVVIGALPGGLLAGTVRKLLADTPLHLLDTSGKCLQDPARSNGSDPRNGSDAANCYGLIFDATGITGPGALDELHGFFHKRITQVAACGRAIVLGTPTADASDPSEAIAQRALEGFVRSLGKELRHGATAQLVYVAPGAEHQLASTLRFLLSPRSAYVSGQVVTIGHAEQPTEIDWARPLKGQVALVTGAARGIGAAVAATLARDGAHVVSLDVPALATELEQVAQRTRGSARTLDITGADAPREIAEHLRDHHGGVDAVVHNAGITRDKSLARMDEQRYRQVLDVNLIAPQRITDALRDGGVLRPGARVVCVSSVNGIAGAAGQTNYATSKAGVIGLVDAYAPLLAQNGSTINAVAPGFIETQMTAKMPLALREAGRRMNSLSQGGLPVDVAETIAWLSSPASRGVNGNVIRVCGQSLIGA